MHKVRQAHLLYERALRPRQGCMQTGIEGARRTNALYGLFRSRRCKLQQRKYWLGSPATRYLSTGKPNEFRWVSKMPREVLLAYKLHKWSPISSVEAPHECCVQRDAQ